MKKIIEEHPGREYDPEMAAEYRKKREERSAAEAAEIEKAADMLLDIVMGKADPIVQQLITPKETQNQESNAIPERDLKTLPSLMQAELETMPEPVPICGIEIEELKPGQRMGGKTDVLRLYNKVIESLQQLADDEEACMAGLKTKIGTLEQDVRKLRIQVFEPLIDWNSLAGEK